MQVTPPNPNTTMSPIFCLLGSCRFLSTGSGKTAVQMSVMMFTAAFENLSDIYQLEDLSSPLPSSYSPNSKTIQAPSTDILVPEILNRPASKKGRKEGPERPSNDDSDQNEATTTELAVGEYPQILKQDREFSEAECEIIDPDRCPEPHQ